MKNQNMSKSLVTEQPATRLRITARGRIAVGVFFTMLMVGVSAIFMMFSAAGASAGDESHSNVVFDKVVAMPGDTMWNIAVEIAPESDPRDVIEDIIKFNQLSSVDLLAGQELSIPAKYN